MTLQLTPDRPLVRASGGSVRYLLCDFAAPSRETSAPRKPLNVALVIDRSGSMAGAKIDHARSAATYALSLLQAEDRIAVVAYDDRVDVIVPSTQASRESIEHAARRIAELHERGNTDLSGGWLTGCREIADRLAPDTVARCLLLTDGLANRGITDPAKLTEHAGALRARGIATSTFGIGEDFDEVLLADMAQAGGGMFRLVRNADEIPRLVREELKESLDVVIAGAQIEVIAPPGLRVTSLNGFPVLRSAEGTTRVQLGDLVSGQLQRPVLRVECPRGAPGEETVVRAVLRDGNGHEFMASGPVTFVHASDDAVTTQPRDRNVDREVASQYAARAQREALAQNRDRDYAGAQRTLDDCIRRIRRYAFDDVEILAVIDTLERAKSRAGQVMIARDRKMAYADSFQRSMLRSSTGATVSRLRTEENEVLVVPCDERTADTAARAIAALLPTAKRVFGSLQVGGRWRDFARTDSAAAVLDPVDELRLIDAARARWPLAGVILVLTPARFADNWFSHWHAAGRCAVVSTHGISTVVGVDPAAYLAYEFLLNGLNNGSARYDLLRMAHEDTRGCLFDFCRDKGDMEIKLQTMHLCPDCESQLRGIGIDLEPVRAATDVIRDLAFSGRLAEQS